ncbi:MAG TPA: BON domain-containing protein [Armatimonadota bacterium]
MTPQQLQLRVEEALLEEDGLDARGIRVVATGRNVWLEGEVPTPDMYDLAERVAGQIGEVADLTNNLICTETPYDISSHRDGIDLRMEPSTDIDEEGRLATRIDPFGEEADEAMPPEGDEEGGPVGGDSGAPIHPMDMNEIAPMASDLLGAEVPWRYQTDGANAHLEEEPVLPPDEDEV